MLARCTASVQNGAEVSNVTFELIDASESLVGQHADGLQLQLEFADDAAPAVTAGLEVWCEPCGNERLDRDSPFPAWP